MVAIISLYTIGHTVGTSVRLGEILTADKNRLDSKAVDPVAG